jgi:hypothetical protein
MLRTIAGVVGGLVVLVAGAVLLLVASRPNGSSNTGYRVMLGPVSALSLTLCHHELRIKHMTKFRLDCQPAQDRPWFDIRVRNVSDRLGFPVCRAEAFDQSGNALFEQDVPIYILTAVSGPPVIEGTGIHLVWYFSKGDSSYVEHRPWNPTQIDHYTASCHGRPDSQVPI